MKQLYFELMHPDATLPTRGTPGAIGLDLYSVERQVIDPYDRETIATGLAVAIPEGYYGRIAPRSGLAHKHGLDVLAGVIDSDYRGEVKVILVNHSDELVELPAKTRIAQLILERADQFTPVRVGTLDKTLRGKDGFGSTGE